MNCFQIMVVRVAQREQTAIDVQKVLTEFGCSIRTRLGLHDQNDDNTCSPSGILILQLCCGENTAKELEGKLNVLPGVKAKLVSMD
ncbi:MAG: hypothetical protein LLF78_00595 [Synergistaceae bacterium]|nr:hypothetical protein [Synergistaceae bacterium]